MKYFIGLIVGLLFTGIYYLGFQEGVMFCKVVTWIIVVSASIGIIFGYTKHQLMQYTSTLFFFGLPVVLADFIIFYTSKESGGFAMFVVYFSSTILFYAKVLNVKYGRTTHTLQ